MSIPSPSARWLYLVAAVLALGAGLYAGAALRDDRPVSGPLQDLSLYRDADTGDLWRVARGTRYKVPSEAVARDLGFDRRGVRRATHQAITALPQGLPYPARGSFLAPGVDCAPAPLHSESQIGIAIVVPSRVLLQPSERAAYYGALTCMRQISPNPIVLRAQLPIDAAFLKPGDREFGEIESFTQLVQEFAGHVTPIVTFRGSSVSTDANCGVPELVSDPPTTRPVTVAEFSGALGRCEFPTPALYAMLFSKARERIDALAPNVIFGAWNEPNHRGFTLAEGRPANIEDATVWAARTAGRYWAEANRQAPGRVLAGEFASSRNVRTLRDAYFGSTSSKAAGRWALHPYSDLSAGLDINAPDSMTNTFFDSDTLTWLTEVGARLDGRAPNDDATAQFITGQQLRTRLTGVATRVALYGLTSGGSSFDSSIGDRRGAARPIVCGLGGIAATNCTGSPKAFSP